MCGITGWVDWELDLRNQKEILNKMVETMTSRGPDDAGVWLSNHAGLGHRRLVVVDPTGGKQPMLRRQGERTYVICYNGELYNTPELRRELQALGYTFQGHSDTEVLLTAYIAWGKQCLKRLNGIYAFALWDDDQHTLFLARDRMGVKPLFYASRGSAFVFASEIKALLAHPSVSPAVNLEGMAEIFYLGPAHTPGNAIFRDIHELRPGFCLTVSPQGLSMERYWSLHSQQHRDNLDTTIATVRELFCDAVKRQLVADVPVCTLLSGGLDSSAITALAAEHYRDNGLGVLHTFSVDYHGNDHFFRANDFQPNSDNSFIDMMTDFCGTRHHRVTLDTLQLVASLESAVAARDVPGMVDIDSSLLLFCHKIKQHATVALSGECADEIFGGYPWFHRPDALQADTFPWSLKLQERVGIISPMLTEAIRPEDYVGEKYRQTLAEVPRLAGENPHDARIREMFYLNLTWFMTTLLERKDRMSMATGLEVRVPFCDHRLVEYVWNVPWEMKFYNKQEKGLLRQALSGILPSPILNRRKSPYPKTHNPAYLDAVRTRVLEILEDSGSPLGPWINKPQIRKLAQSDSDTMQHPWFGQLMTGPQLFAYLIQVDTWMRRYKVVVR